MVELFHSLSARTHFAHFCVVFNNILQPTEAASDVIFDIFVWQIVLNKAMVTCAILACITFELPAILAEGCAEIASPRIGVIRRHPGASWSLSGGVQERNRQIAHTYECI